MTDEEILSDIEESEKELKKEQISKTELSTHSLINQSLVGVLDEMETGYAKVIFTATNDMVADKRGMIHSGFIFSSANFAAMAAVNMSTAIPVVSKTNFLAPISVNDEAIFEARELHKDTRKRVVKVVGYIHNIKFFDGEFTIVVLDHHPLSLKLV